MNHAINPDAPATAEELARFAALQAQFARSYAEMYEDHNAPRTVVVVPSLTFDQDVIARISGAHHYEERMLCLLLLLRMPRTQVIFVTSTTIPESIIDYYLHLLPGVPGLHARRRLTLVSCDDAAHLPLTRKVLERPRVIERIRELVAHPAAAHMTCEPAAGRLSYQLHSIGARFFRGLPASGNVRENGEGEVEWRTGVCGSLPLH